MKQFFASCLVLLAFATTLVRCSKDERDIDMTLTGVENLLTPADNRSIKLNPAANLTEDFQWSQARAQDGSLVLYEVIFDQENGDFSKPFFAIVSNNRGVENKLTLSHGQLNQIATLGGADFFQKKKFKWAVNASKGTNVVRSTGSRLIELERPGGFSNIPGTVFLYGTATEAGNTLASAHRMRQTGPGEFEIYTRLSPGTFKFADGITGTPRQFSIVDAGGGQLGLTVNGETNFAGTPKVMRIRISFNNINASYLEVKKMEFWYCNANATWFELPYVANGLWRRDAWPTTLATVAWGLEERYKYRMTVNDGGADRFQWVNSNFGDPPGQDGLYPSTLAYRTVNMERNDGSQWDNGWKLDKNYVTQGSVVNYWVSLRGSDLPYFQNYSK